MNLCFLDNGKSKLEDLVSQRTVPYRERRLFATCFGIRLLSEAGYGLVVIKKSAGEQDFKKGRFND